MAYCDKSAESVGEGRENFDQLRDCDRFGYCAGPDCPDWEECEKYGKRVAP